MHRRASLDVRQQVFLQLLFVDLNGYEGRTGPGELGCGLSHRLEQRLGVAVAGELQIVPNDGALANLATDHRRLVDDGLLPDDVEPFEALLERRRIIQDKANIKRSLERTCLIRLHSQRPSVCSRSRRHLSDAVSDHLSHTRQGPFMSHAS
jgi:hypothetical protein